MSPAISSIEERLARLENENRRLASTLYAVATVAAIAAVVGLVAGAGAAAAAMLLASSAAMMISARSSLRVPQVIQARKLEVVSENGQVLVALGETAGGDGAVATYDCAGKRVGHVSRVDRDEFYLRNPGDQPASEKPLAPSVPMRYQNTH